LEDDIIGGEDEPATVLIENPITTEERDYAGAAAVRKLRDGALRGSCVVLAEAKRTGREESHRNRFRIAERLVEQSR
jgi:hypothetical protein